MTIFRLIWGEVLSIALSRLLVIGGSGFVGHHLLELTASKQIETYATKLPFEKIDAHCQHVFDLDIMDIQSVINILRDIRPQAVVHLAAQSSVGASWKSMDNTIDINIKGAIHVLDAIKQVDPSIRLLLIGSSDEYGRITTSGKVSEKYVPDPVNPYAISKLAQTMLGKMYHRAFGLDVVMMRAFNHIGEGQKQGFVVPDFCRQIVEIENGIKPPILYVGDLTSARDFSDVRDIVCGYLLAILRGKSGEIYNIGSGKSVTIETILNFLLKNSKVPIQVVQDPEKMRPAETSIIAADISKLQSDTGYSPSIPLEESLVAVLNYERLHYRVKK